MSLPPLLRAGLLASLFGSILFAAGCGDSGGDTGPTDPVTIEKAPSKSGDGQAGIVGLELPAPIRVLITRNGTPVSNAAVTWSAQDGGAMTPSVTESGDDGIAETAWILGPEDGTQTASASVEDGIGSPVSFSAEAVEDQPPLTTTVQVLDNQFSPKDVTILVGQTVTWVWGEGASAHNVAPTDGLVPSRSGEPVAAPHQYVYTFPAPGVYNYYCEVHGTPGGLGMVGSVTVLATAP
jgi:plastocyanin